jgi:hypothetical protein
VGLTQDRGTLRSDLVVPLFLVALAGVLLQAGPHADSLLSGVGNYFFFGALISGAIAVALFLAQLLIPRLRPVVRGLRRIVGFLATIVAVGLIVSISCTTVITREQGQTTESPKPTATPAGDLLKNGDFTRGLESWTTKTQPGVFVGFAKADIRKLSGRSVATLEVPGFSEAYLEQEVTLPLGPIQELNVSIFKERAPVFVYVSLLTKDGNVAELDRFTPACSLELQCSPDLKRYDLSSRAGQTIRVRIGATSTAAFGAAVYIDAVRIIPSR